MNTEATFFMLYNKLGYCNYYYYKKNKKNKDATNFTSKLVRHKTLFNYKCQNNSAKKHIAVSNSRVN